MLIQGVLLADHSVSPARSFRKSLPGRSFISQKLVY